MNDRWSSEKSHNVISFNNWLREESRDLSSMLQASTDSLLAVQQELRLVLASETTMEPSRVSRVILAITHLTVETHLLVTLTRRGK